jgi:hypothetical protein
MLEHSTTPPLAPLDLASFMAIEHLEAAFALSQEESTDIHELT